MTATCQRCGSSLDVGGVCDWCVGMAQTATARQRVITVAAPITGTTMMAVEIDALRHRLAEAERERDEARAAADAHALDAAASLRHLHEARALLRECRQWFDEGPDADCPDDLCARLDAALGGER